MSNDNPQETTSDSQRGGVPSKRSQTLKALGMSSSMLNILASIAKNKTAQDSARVSAAGKILDKALPNMQATELTGKDGQPLQLKYLIDLAGDYIPPLGPFNASSGTNIERQSQIQSPSLAPESQKNNNSSNTIGTPSTV